MGIKFKNINILFISINFVITGCNLQTSNNGDILKLPDNNSNDSSLPSSSSTANDDIVVSSLGSSSVSSSSSISEESSSSILSSNYSSIIDSQDSSSSNDVTNQINDNRILQIVNGTNHLLKDEDKDTGVFFADYTSLISYKEEMQLLVDNSHWSTGVYSNAIVSSIESIDETIFNSYNLLFSKELLKPDSSYSFSLAQMYFENDNLHVEFYRSSSGWGSAWITYNVFILLLDKNASFNNLIYKIVDETFGVID